MRKATLELKRLLSAYPDTWVRTFSDGRTIIGFATANPTKERQMQVMDFLREKGVQCKSSDCAAGTSGYCVIHVV